MKERGLDLTLAAKQGRYLSLDAANTLSKVTVNGWPDAARFSRVMGNNIRRLALAARGEHRVAAFGEMVALLWAEGKPDAAIRLEQLWNELGGTHSFHLHCAYPLSFFSKEGDGESVRKICAEHSQFIPAESYTNLASDEERLRSIIFLQQKAQALEREILEYKEAQQTLQSREAELKDFIENAVTQQKKMEMALHTSEKLASVGRLAATVAHEINNPLEAVTNFIYLAKLDPALPENVKGYLTHADNELGRVAHLVQQTLGFYRDNSAAARLAIVDVIQDVLITYERKIKHKELHIEKKIEPGLEIATLLGELRQILSNLVANAIDASKDGGKIVIGARASRHFHTGRPGIRITIADTGVGMSREQKKKLFMPFFTTKKEVGTGLGLWITKDLLEKKGGHIRFRSSDQGKSGTVISIFLPLESPAAAAGASPVTQWS